VAPRGVGLGDPLPARASRLGGGDCALQVGLGDAYSLGVLGRLPGDPFGLVAFSLLAALLVRLALLGLVQSIAEACHRVAVVRLLSVAMLARRHASSLARVDANSCGSRPDPPLASPTVTRVLSCIQPTGEVHLGNYFGALRPWVEGQHEKDVFHGIVDLHALTVIEKPGVVGEATINLAAMLFAVGLDPEVATVFVQSHVREHSQLAWIMECTVSYGELSRMTQFKDKTSKRHGQFISAGLLTYPALQAADILLYDTDEVPVGDDQRQHVEITRDIAERFNFRFGDTFVIPAAVIPRAGARVMDLQDPTSKMSKSADTESGCVMMLDSPDEIVKKFKRAVTDSESEVRYDVAAKPGVSSLLDILAAATGRTPQEAAVGYEQYGRLKQDTGEAVVALLEPIQTRYRDLIADKGELARLLQIGAGRARSVASVTLQRAYDAIGLIRP